jgi:hypothetical protein
MNSKRKTLEEVRKLGLQILARELGPADFVRFIQQFETGQGDYTEERHRWLDQLDGEAIIEAIEQRRYQGQERGQQSASDAGAIQAGDRQNPIPE